MSLTCMDPKFDTDFCFTKLLYLLGKITWNVMKSTSLQITMTLSDCFIFFLYGDLRSATDYFLFQKNLEKFLCFLVLFFIFAESWLDSWIIFRPAFSAAAYSVTESAGKRFEKFVDQTETGLTEAKNLHVEFPFSHFLSAKENCAV